MKILILNETLNLGGAENMVVTLSNTLQSTPGLEIRVAASSGEMIERLSKDIKYYELPSYDIFSSLKIIKTLSYIIGDYYPDIIHTHSATMAVLVYISIKSISSKTKLILTHHSRKFSRLPNRVAVFILNKIVDIFIAISNSKYQEMVHLGVNNNKIVFIPNFVDNINLNELCKVRISKRIRKEIGLSNESRIIIGCGNIRKGKGFERFVDIVNLCAMSLDQKIIGLIIGDGELLCDVKVRANFYEGDSKILFLGYKKNITDYLLASDVFLFPSEHEVLPMALIEASSCGIPIVCSDIIGNNDVVCDSLNGFLVSGDNYEYSKTINKILADSDLQKYMSKQGLKISKDKFDKNLVVNAIIQLYVDTIRV